MKVPAIIACSLICLVIGLGVGGLAGIYLGPEMPPWLGGPPVRATEEIGEKGADAASMMAKKGMNGGPGMMPGKGMGGPGKGGGGMPKGPTSKTQLTTLVSKLDALTQKPLTVTLDTDQKKQIAEQLKGLGTMDELSDDEAKQRLDAILTVLKDQKEPLEATGFRWPGQ